MLVPGTNLKSFEFISTIWSFINNVVLSHVIYHPDFHSASSLDVQFLIASCDGLNLSKTQTNQVKSVSDSVAPLFSPTL